MFELFYEWKLKGLVESNFLGFLHSYGSDLLHNETYLVHIYDNTKLTNPLL